MTGTSIYKDIAERTGGDIYIGVVGPVRTGKSTLIKRLITDLALPNINSEFLKERTRDELPQSASGKTVMTTEPKFVPEEGVEIKLDGNATFNLRMIDCVGYIVPEAIGHFENGEPRMVMTPWSTEAMPFEKAAEIGTKKVITDHSTIGLLVTTDGTIGEIPRESYVAAERRVANELKEINKPFIIILNSARPSAQQTLDLAKELESEYSVSVVPVNCLELNENDIKDILANLLYEFPIKEMNFNVPGWFEALDDNYPLKSVLFETMNIFASKVQKVGDVHNCSEEVGVFEESVTSQVESIRLGEGAVTVAVKIPSDIFYTVLGEKSGFEIKNDRDLFEILNDLSDIRKKYTKIEEALEMVNETGYGIVSPTIDDMTLEEPEIVKQSGGYGVKLKASAPSIHIVCNKQKYTIQAWI